MTKDIVTYTNHLGFTIGLNNPEITDALLCDVVDLRPFNYQTDKGGTTTGSKEFELTVIARSRNYANFAIDYLTADAYESKYGTLRVNDWYLRCRCLGVNSIDTENGTDNPLEGLYKFVLKFEAPSMLWANKTYYMYNGSTNLFYPRKSDDSGWDSTGVTRISVVNIGGGAYAVSMSWISPYQGDTSGQIKDDFAFDFKDLNNAGTQIGKVTYKINLNDYYAIRSDFLTKRIEYAAGAMAGMSAIDSVPDDSDWFAAHPYSALSYLENIQGTVSGNLYFTIHRLRGMPEWV